MTPKRQWLSEGLFWLHFFVILGGVLMGLVLPWWLALGAIAAHRVHLKIFDGCALSRLQKKTSCLTEEQDYLQDVSRRLFSTYLPKQCVKTVDRALVGVSIIVIALAYSGFGWLVIVITTALLALYGLKTSWRMLKRPAQNICMVGSSCNTVKQSNFSKIFGLPIELLGVGYFSFLTVGQVLLAFNNFQPAILQTILFGLLSVGLATSVFFIFVQARVMHSLCTSCMNIHGVSFSVGIVQAVTIFV